MQEDYCKRCVWRKWDRCDLYGAPISEIEECGCRSYRTTSNKYVGLTAVVLWIVILSLTVSAYLAAVLESAEILTYTAPSAAVLALIAVSLLMRNA